jgi:sugar phosphate permease
MFWTGALPALLVVWLRRRVHDAPRATAAREQSPGRGSFTAIFRPARDGDPGLLRTTVLASLLSTGVQGGYYTLATWVPTYLKSERGLSVVGTGGYLTFLISGAFLGYLSGGHLTDRLGRRPNIWLFALLSSVCVLVYAHIPHGADTLLLVLGFPLGFCMSAIFSGFGSYLSELYPTRVRGTGQGFTYNTGRAVGAVFPTLVGFLADSWGVGGALVFGAIGYGLAALALLGLPETRGRELA